MNVLSIGAAYGVVVAVFQWGWGGELLGIERRADQPVHPDDALRRRLRPVHGLRGLHALPHPGGVRAHRRRHDLGGRRPGLHRPGHHRRRRDHGRGLRRPSCSRTSARSSCSASAWPSPCCSTPPSCAWWWCRPPWSCSATATGGSRRGSTGSCPAVGGAPARSRACAGGCLTGVSRRAARCQRWCGAMPAAGAARTTRGAARRSPAGRSGPGPSASMASRHVRSPIQTSVSVRRSVATTTSTLRCGSTRQRSTARSSTTIQNVRRPVDVAQVAAGSRRPVTPRPGDEEAAHVPEEHIGVQLVGAVVAAHPALAPRAEAVDDRVQLLAGRVRA